jgi:hypothetical protein
MSEEQLPDECCAKCRFGQKEIGTSDSGHVFLRWVLCRRRPPILLDGAKACVRDAEDGATVASAWSFPVMIDDDWCGEFQLRPASPKPKRDPLSDQLIRDVDFSGRTKKALAKNGVTTLSQLCDKTEDDLRCLRRIGDVAVANIRDTLAKIGWELKDEPTIA